MKKFIAVLPLSLLCLSAPLAISEVKPVINNKLEASEVSKPMKEFLVAFDKLSKGFKIEGSVNQSKSLVGRDQDGNLVPVPGQTETQTYNVDVIFENGDRTGTALIHKGAFGEMETIIDELIVYEDEEGYCYSEYLDYANTIQRQYKIEDHNKLGFAAAGLYNFTEILDEHDFKYDEKRKRFDVNLDKVSIIVKNLLAHTNIGFMYTPAQATMKVTNGEISNFEVKMETFDRVEEVEGGYALARYGNLVKFKFSDIGTAKIPAVKKFPANADNGELKIALDGLKDNFTADIESTISIDGATPATKYRTFKFNGENILVHNYNSLAEKDTLKFDDHFILKTMDESDKLFSFAKASEEGEYEKKPVVGFAGNYQGLYYYEDLLPQASLVSTDFFTYDSDKDEYICRDRDILSNINSMFTVSKAPFIDSNVDNAQALGIRVNADGTLDHVRFYVNYMDGFTGVKYQGQITVNYSNIGSTTF